jgi:hypothetical protein
MDRAAPPDPIRGDSMNRSILAAALLLAVACGENTPGVIQGKTDTEEERDTTPPVIEHDPITGYVIAGQPLLITCTVTDAASTILSVEIYFKQETSKEWTQRSLARGDGDAWEFEIPSNFVGNGSSGLDYYLYALDASTNYAYFPDGGRNEAIHVRVSAG